jgi:hypothetical protein
MFAQSIAFDLSDIVAGFKLGPQQFVASAGRFLQRSGGLLDLNLWSSWSHWLPLSRGGSNGAICCQHGLHSCHVDPKPFLFISTFFVC